jgi:hypothetical protein
VPAPRRAPERLRLSRNPTLTADDHNSTVGV